MSADYGMRRVERSWVGEDISGAETATGGNDIVKCVDHEQTSQAKLPGVARAGVEDGATA